MGSGAKGHTWPYEGNPFPSQLVAEQTWANMFELQLEQWTKVPLATNTQPDFSNVGNADMVDRTIRTGNWLRTDTIFIENTQIEALSYRPPWAAAICEVGFTTGDPKELRIDEDGITYNEQIISHAADVGVNYLSLWSWHNQSAAQHPELLREVPRAHRRRSRGRSATASAHRSSGPSLATECPAWSLDSPTMASRLCPGVLRMSIVGR